MINLILYRFEEYKYKQEERFEVSRFHIAELLAFFISNVLSLLIFSFTVLRLFVAISPFEYSDAETFFYMIESIFLEFSIVPILIILSMFMSSALQFYLSSWIMSKLMNLSGEMSLNDSRKFYGARGLLSVVFYIVHIALLYGLYTTDTYYNGILIWPVFMFFIYQIYWAVRALSNLGRVTKGTAFGYWVLVAVIMSLIFRMGTVGPMFGVLLNVMN